jgi:hypothetical protein
LLITFSNFLNALLSIEFSSIFNDLYNVVYYNI